MNGGSFTSTAVVRWSGKPLATTFVSGTKLTAQVSASDITAAGTSKVSVFDSATNLSSNVVTFNVN